MAALFPKDPIAVLKYTQSWVDWLSAGETISTSTWAVPAGITKDSESNTTTTASVVLSGGTVGTTYRISNTITTNQGQTDKRSIDIRVEQR